MRFRERPFMSPTRRGGSRHVYHKVCDDGREKEAGQRPRLREPLVYPSPDHLKGYPPSHHPPVVEARWS